MSAKLRLWGRSASSVWMILAAAYAAFACSTSEVNGNDAGSSTTSSNSTSVTSTTSVGSTTSVTSSTSTSSACSVKVPTPMPGDAGTSNLIGALCPPDDSGAPGRFCFGTFASYGGGSYFYPSNNGLVADAGMDVPANVDAGNYCAVLSSQNTFVAQPTTQGWAMSGTVAGYSGVGLFFFHCVDASATQGVQFTISGDIGNAAGVGDAGPTANQLMFSVSNQADLLVDSGGNCTLGSTCVQSTTAVDVTSTPTLVQVPWSKLMGGNPQVSDPGQVVGIQWSWPWPCSVSPSVYSTNVVIQDVSFY